MINVRIGLLIVTLACMGHALHGAASTAISKNARDLVGFSGSLTTAIENNDVTAVKTILGKIKEKGIDINTLPLDEETVSFGLATVIKDNIEIAQLLALAGLDDFKQGNITMLKIFAMQPKNSHNELKMLQYLDTLSSPEDIHAADPEGNTLLHCALSAEINASFAVIEYLLKRGADPLQKNNNNETPISLAHAQSNPKLIALLNKYIKKEPAPLVVSPSPTSPTEIAGVHVSDSPAPSPTFTEKRLDSPVPMMKVETKTVGIPIFDTTIIAPPALSKDEQKIIDTMAKSGKQDPRFVTLAHNGRTGAIKYAIDKKVNLESIDHGDTALIAATKAGHLEIVRLLVDASANIYAKGGKGNALHNATILARLSKDHAAILELLKEKDAALRQKKLEQHEAEKQQKKLEKEQRKKQEADARAKKEAEAIKREVSATIETLIKSLEEEAMRTQQLAIERQEKERIEKEKREKEELEQLQRELARKRAQEIEHGVKATMSSLLDDVEKQSTVMPAKKEESETTPKSYTILRRPQSVSPSSSSPKETPVAPSKKPILLNRYKPLTPQDDARQRRTTRMALSPKKGDPQVRYYDKPESKRELKPKKLSIFDAARHGLVSEVERYITTGADVNSIDEQGQSLLYIALTHLRNDVVDLLRSHDAEFKNLYEALAAYDYVAIHNATQRGYDAQKTKDLRTYYRQQVLDQYLANAVSNNNDDAVEECLLAGANPDYRDHRNDYDTCLLVATESGKIPLMKMLIDHGARIDIPNKHDQTPLSMAYAWALSHNFMPMYLISNHMTSPDSLLESFALKPSKKASLKAEKQAFIAKAKERRDELEKQVFDGKKPDEMLITALDEAIEDTQQSLKEFE